MKEEKTIRKTTTGVIIFIIIITGVYGGCFGVSNTQNQNQNLNQNTTSSNTSLQQNHPPRASCSANTTFGYAPLAVSFQGSGTDTDGMIISYYWDFGDGTISLIQNPTHLYSKPGTYIALLKVSDGDGACDNDTIEITVMPKPNIPPTANFTYSPSSPNDSNVIQFTDQSTDSDGHIICRRWDFGDEGNSTLQNPTHKYADNGTYQVTLTILDNDSEINSLSKIIMVSNVPPAAAFTYSPSSPSDSDMIQFTDQSTDSDGHIISRRWDFGDGNSSSIQNPSHQYGNTGTYEVTLTVNDNDASVSEINKEIIINEHSNDSVILTMTYHGNQKTYTRKELENMDSVTGYGGRLNKVGTIVGPFIYKGVPISALANEFSLIPTTYNLQTISTDGYIYNYTQGEIQGNIQVYDTEGYPHGVGGVTMILAYEENGIQNFSDGPLRIAFVADEKQLTDAFRWAKYVTKIEFFDAYNITCAYQGVFGLPLSMLSGHIYHLFPCKKPLSIVSENHADASLKKDS